ncbi:MAG: hypothetical protein KY446_04220 [Proteobacteria bacterium]|nr:hypothetical protein [Pseudomonadota bacterium]
MISSSLRSAAIAAAGFAFACVFGAPAHAQFHTPGPEESAAMAKPAPLELPRSVFEEAVAFQLYMGRAAGLSSSFANGSAIAETVRGGAAYEPRQLGRGAVAYGALVALQDPAFVRSLRGRSLDPARRKELAARIWRDPAVVVSLPGADSAAGLVVAAVSDEGARLRGVGDRIKQSAYDIQQQPWSKNEVAGRDKRLAEVKALSLSPLPTSPADVERLRLAAVGDTPLTLAPAVKPIYSPVVQRALAVAALAALGEAGEDEAALEPLLTEPECASCLKMAKLNLFQCLAVAKPWYEDVFCIGQHGLKDTGDCLAETRSIRWRPAATPAAAATPTAVAYSAQAAAYATPAATAAPAAAYRAGPTSAYGRPAVAQAGPAGRPGTDPLSAWRRPDSWTRY